MSSVFDHEKLEVYKRSLDFVEFTEETLPGLPNSLSVCGQLDRSSASIPLSIAEGNSIFTGKNRCRFFDIARGSALECAAALDVLNRKNRIDEETAAAGKTMLLEIVSLLGGLIRSQYTDRLYEEQGADTEGE